MLRPPVVEGREVPIKGARVDFPKGPGSIFRTQRQIHRHILCLAPLIIIDVKDPKARIILPDTEAVIAGFATGEVVSKAPLGDFGSKFGGRGGYNCKFIAIRDLSPMDKFHEAYGSIVSKQT